MRPLCVIAFYDSRAGHAKQTRGILTALAALLPLEVHGLRVPDGTLARDIRDWLVFARHLAGHRADFPAIAGFSKAPSRADLVIGTGARCHIPLLCLARATGARAVTCMSPAWPLAGLFDLVFVPEHDRRPRGKNVITTLGPPNTARPGGVKDPSRALVLVGGTDPKSHVWDSGKILAMVETLAVREPETRFTVTSSPRTPAALEEDLRALSKGRGNLEFHAFRETAPGWVEARLSECGRAWVTADSASMLHEALSAGCGVGVLPVTWKSMDNKLARGLCALTRRGMALAFDKALAGAPWPNVPPLDEAGRAAREMVARWWNDR